MNIEIEARFLNINKDELIRKLVARNAIDKKEHLLSEIIFYDSNNKWPAEGRFVRLRTNGETTALTYKHNRGQTIDSMTEIEFEVPDMDVARAFLENIGLVAFRFQEKRRHSFVIDSVIVDIDTWPKIPTYVEIEGPSEDAVKLTADKLGFAWSDAVFDDARSIIEKRYGIPVGSMRSFTFDKVE
jgi:adenylate cyclase, class 2